MQKQHLVLGLLAKLLMDAHAADAPAPTCEQMRGEIGCQRFGGYEPYRLAPKKEFPCVANANSHPQCTGRLMGASRGPQLSRIASTTTDATTMMTEQAVPHFPTDLLDECP